MGASLAQAVRDVVTQRRVALVLAVGTLLSLIPYAGISDTGRRSTWGVVLSIVVGALVFGYQLSYARRLAVDRDSSLPRLVHVLEHARRGIIGTALYMLPAYAVIGLATGLQGLLAGVVTGDLALMIVTTVFFAAAGLGFLAVSVLEIVVGARYAYFDTFREGVRYSAGLGAAWRCRRAVALPLLVGAAWALTSILLRHGLGIALGSRLLLGFRGALLRMTMGDSSMVRLGIVAAVTAITVVDVAVMLVIGNLVGQYAHQAFGPEDADSSPAESAE